MDSKSIVQNLQELKRKAETNFGEIKSKLAKLQQEYTTLMQVQDKLKEQIRDKKLKFRRLESEEHSSRVKKRRRPKALGRNVAIRVKGRSRGRRRTKRKKTKTKKRCPI